MDIEIRTLLLEKEAGRDCSIGLRLLLQETLLRAESLLGLGHF
jgi:hypothetical protein